MRCVAALLVTVLIPLSACSDGGGSTDAIETTTEPSTGSTVAGAEQSATLPETPSTAPTSTPLGTASAPATTPVFEDDLVTFIAASEAALEGTRYQGAIFEAPEPYIALAVAACARFSAGDELEQIVADLLAELGGTGENDEDDERLAGAIIGAATRTICTEHSDEL
jgi:hypothetical protein